MKRFYIILIFALLFSGCATYKIQKKPSGEAGFVALRYGKVIPEYTVGANNSFPDKESLAKERFKRRKSDVEYYYKQMGYIENRFRQLCVEPPLTLVQFVFGIFRIPFIAAADYKYNHNPKYKEKIDKLEDQEYELEKARVKGLKDNLSEYIKEDLSKEPGAVVSEQPKPKEDIKAVVTLQEESNEIPAAVSAEVPLEVKPALAPIEPEVKSISTQAESEMEAALKPAESVEPEAKVIESVKPDLQEEAMAIQEDLKSTSAVEEPKLQVVKPEVSLPSPNAVIIVKPVTGPSPLKVNFSGQKSSSPNGTIVAYSWDFGDGDKSNKSTAINTYWSTTYGTREFIATLTVTDNKGMASSSSVAIQVVNK